MGLPRRILGAVYEVVRPGDTAVVRDEVARQAAAFRRLMDRDPTHIDSHQHVHDREPVRSIVLQAAQEWGIPLRPNNPGVCYCGKFYGQTVRGLPWPEGVGVEGLIRTLQALPPGVTERACHPAAELDFASVYAGERIVELATLCDPCLRLALTAESIELSDRTIHLAS